MIWACAVKGRVATARIARRVFMIDTCSIFGGAALLLIRARLLRK
jgi:hypothetical protein